MLTNHVRQQLVPSRHYCVAERAGGWAARAEHVMHGGEALLEPLVVNAVTPPGARSPPARPPALGAVLARVPVRDNHVSLRK